MTNYIIKHAQIILLYYKIWDQICIIEHAHAQFIFGQYIARVISIETCVLSFSFWAHDIPNIKLTIISLILGKEYEILAKSLHIFFLRLFLAHHRTQ